MTKQALNVLSFVLAAFAVVMFAAAAVQGWRASTLGTQEQLVVDAADKSFGTASANSKVMVTFTLANRSARTIAIVGSRGSCGAEGCVKVVGLPLLVPPRQERDLTVEVSTLEPGNLEQPAMVYTDCASKTEFYFTIRGTVVGDALSGREAE